MKMCKKRGKSLSLTSIRKLLREITWNPKEKTLISAALSVGKQEYFVLRAMEMLQQSQQLSQVAQQRKALINAARLITAALYELDRGE
jgi:ribosomal protein L29